MCKKSLGQYFTSKDIWLKNHIKEFILKTNTNIVFDPFAGNGFLLKDAKELGYKKFIGYDIDNSLGWDYNDSLLEIPFFEKSIIITNPPYLTNYSAKRKGIIKQVQQYFNFGYDDIYKLALERMLEKNKYIVAIIPETFINSNFSKARLHNITILEENPFDDTENPVCIVCFDDKIKNLNKIKVYKNDTYLDSLGYFYSMRLNPINAMKLKFNDIQGQIALRGVDTTQVNKKIEFMKKDKLDYNLKGIKHSSRLITIINVYEKISNMEEYIYDCNEFLNEYRIKTQDILFSPFKGNNKGGQRRRRLDYRSARAIMENVFLKKYQKNNVGLFA